MRLEARRPAEVRTPEAIRAWELHVQDCPECAEYTAPADGCGAGTLIYAAARLAALPGVWR